MKFSKELSAAFKDFFQKLPFFFLGTADFEYKEIGFNTKIVEKTTNIYEQSAVSWGLTIVSELENLSNLVISVTFDHFV